MQRPADVVLGAAGLLAVTGLLLVLLAPDPDGSQASVACDGRGCSVAVSGRF